MSKNKTTYTVIGRHFIKDSDMHFLYINAKNPFTKDNHFITQCINGSYGDMLNRYSDLDDLGDKDMAKEYWVEIYGHNVDDFFDALDNLEENGATTFIPIL